MVMVLLDVLELGSCMCHIYHHTITYDLVSTQFYAALSTKYAQYFGVTRGFSPTLFNH